MKIFLTDFEIFGRVQGVFFRKFTKKQAILLGLKGWCMNTAEGTVKGQIEGPKDKSDEMKLWLQTKGSPQSRIEKAVFSDMQEQTESKFQDFLIKG